MLVAAYAGFQGTNLVKTALTGSAKAGVRLGAADGRIVRGRPWLSRGLRKRRPGREGTIVLKKPAKGMAAFLSSPFLGRLRRGKDPPRKGCSTLVKARCQGA